MPEDCRVVDPEISQIGTSQCLRAQWRGRGAGLLDSATTRGMTGQGAGLVDFATTRGMTHLGNPIARSSCPSFCAFPTTVILRFPHHRHSALSPPPSFCAFPTTVILRGAKRSRRIQFEVSFIDSLPACAMAGQGAGLLDSATTRRMTGQVPVGRVLLDLAFCRPLRNFIGNR